MIGQDRIRVFAGVLIVVLVSILGMTPILHLLPFPLNGVWPIAGFWLAISCARLEMSIWSAVCIMAVGFVQDFITDAPLGAWPLAFLSAYGTGLIANHGLGAVAASFPKELPALIGGLFVGVNVLAMAGDIAGGADVIDASLWADIILTGGLYYLVTSVLAPMKESLVR